MQRNVFQRWPIPGRWHAGHLCSVREMAGEVVQAEKRVENLGRVPCSKRGNERPRNPNEVTSICVPENERLQNPVVEIPRCREECERQDPRG